uniref:Uncharacterized protein n=1 Tax=Caulobacter phage BL57 TaxID=3348355 RepID=A0AB74UMT3_9VIRU
MTPASEKPAYALRHQGHLFEVYKAPEGHTHQFVGYCDGELSVSANRVDVAIRALALKHEPTAEVIDFTAYRLQRLGEALSA